MFLKNTLLAVIAFSASCMTISYAMRRDIPELDAKESTIVKGAATFAIHNAKCDDECSAYDLLTHAEGTLVVTYYNRDNIIIAMIDVTDLDLLEELLDARSEQSLANNYAKQRLDPDAKPKAHKAIIDSHPIHGREVYFYEKDGTHIIDLSYDGPATKDGLMRFAEYVNLSALEIIENNEPEGGCTLF